MTENSWAYATLTVQYSQGVTWSGSPLPAEPEGRAPIQEFLTLAGQNGWELAGVLPQSSEMTMAMFVFKRPAGA